MKSIEDLQRVLLRRADLVWVSESPAPESKPSRRWPWSRVADQTTSFATFSSILAQLGHAMGPRLAARVSELQPTTMAALRTQLEAEIVERMGARRPTRPMYPGFPKQVLSAPAAELHLNAMIHYFGDAVGLRLLPDYEDLPRPPLPEKLQDLRILELAEDDDPGRLANRLLASPVAGSANTHHELAVLIAHLGSELPRWLPNEIPNKENLAGLFQGLLKDEQAAEPRLELVTPFVQTATDVLRLAVATAEGDLSLAEPCRFRGIHRKLRRHFLSLLESLPSAQRDEDIWRRPGVWKRLGERLHPGEYAGRYPSTARSFRWLRQGERPETPARRVEAALRAGNVAEAAAALTRRPGEFLRRLDHLLRSAPDSTGDLLRQLDRCVDEVSTTVLLQVLAHFRQRHAPPPLRVFFPKGKVSSAFGLPDRRVPLPSETCAAVASRCADALVQRFSGRENLGAVWVDPGLAAFPAPFALRSNSRSLRTLTRGSRLPLHCPATLRFFLWWKEGRVDDKPTGRVDVDLSAVLYRDGWEYAEHISYTNLRSADYRATHSGDITSAPEGACEFIDLDLPSLRQFGVRYVVLSVFSFTHQPFAAMPECFAGWMNREEPDSGEIFEPSTVVDRLDLAGNTKISVPVILDLANDELIWADLSLSRGCAWVNNVEGTSRGMILMGKAITNLVRPTLADLFTLHAKARGNLVENPEEADTVFATPGLGRTDVITPFDQDRILAEFL